MLTTRVNLKDVADRANVATSTVSRALSGGRGVSPDKAEQIVKLARTMGYRVKSQPVPSSRAIGLVVGDASVDDGRRAHQHDVVWQVALCASARNLHLDVCVVNQQSADALPAFVTQGRVDRLLITGCPSPQLVARLIETGLPTIAISDTVDRLGCPCVMPAAQDGTYSAVRQMIGMGHRNIAFITGPVVYPSVRRREEGYHRAMQDAGLEVPDSWTVRVLRNSLEQSAAAIRQLMARRDRPTAIVFSGDLLALGGLIEANRLGIKVPDELSLIGHDDSAIARDATPPLTSVDLRLSQCIQTAVDYLERQVNQPDATPGPDSPPQFEVDVEVKWRASCGPAPLDPH